MEKRASGGAKFTDCFSAHLDCSCQILLNESDFPGWLGVLLSFAGVALIASGEGEGIHLSPQALSFSRRRSASAVYVSCEALSRPIQCARFTAYSIWFGALLMLPFGRGFLRLCAWRRLRRHCP
jgi:hypothetical protein